MTSLYIYPSPEAVECDVCGHSYPQGYGMLETWLRPGTPHEEGVVHCSDCDPSELAQLTTAELISDQFENDGQLFVVGNKQIKTEAERESKSVWRRHDSTIYEFKDGSWLFVCDDGWDILTLDDDLLETSAGVDVTRIGRRDSLFGHVLGYQYTVPRQPGWEDQS